MASDKSFFKKITGNVFLKHVILAVCSVFVFLFLISFMLKTCTRHNKSNQVPDFSGLTVGEAKKAGSKGSLRIEVSDSIFVPAYEGGIILDQLPKPGTAVKSGRRIFVTVNAFSQRMVRIPYVAGFSLRQAKNNLEVAGLEIDRLIFRPDMASNNVLEQQYNGKTIGPGSTLEAEQGSGITLIVGTHREDPYPSVPKVVGFPLKDAKSRLWEIGLNVGKVEMDENITLLNRNEARVYVQHPGQGTKQAPGTAVDIKLTLDTEKITKASTDSDRAAKRIIPVQEAEDRARVQAARVEEDQKNAEGTEDMETEEPDL